MGKRGSIQLLAVVACSFLLLPARAAAAEPDTVRAALLNTMQTVKSGQFTGSVAAYSPSGLPAIEVRVDLLFDARKRNDLRVKAKFWSTTGPGDVIFTVAKGRLFANFTYRKKTYTTRLKEIGITTPPAQLPDQVRRPLADSVINKISDWRTDGADAVEGVPVTVYSGLVDLNEVVTSIVPALCFLPPARQLDLPGIDKQTVDYVISLITAGGQSRIQLGVDGANLVRFFGVTAPLTYPGGPGELRGRFEMRRLNQTIKIRDLSRRQKKRAQKVSVHKLNKLLNEG